MICREFNCLFVHVPKTAGQSIEQFFMSRLGCSWERDADRERFLLSVNPDRTCGTRKLAHLSAAEYVACGHLSPQDFQGLYKFSFVRNPWQRLVSEYLYRNYFSHRSFGDFVLRRLPRAGWDDQYRHIMPQYDMLHDAGGRLLVDFVGRFENLQQDFEIVCEQLGIGAAQLPHRNPSDKASRRLRRRARNSLWRNGENAKRHWTEFYDEQTLGVVSELYRKDIEAFGYRFPVEAGAA